MCGIIAVLAARSTRPVPAVSELLPTAREAVRELAGAPHGAEALAERMRLVAGKVRDLDGVLRGGAGVRALVAEPAAADELGALMSEAARHADALEALLEAPAPAATLEAANSALIELKDACWAVRVDRLTHARAVGALAGPGAGAAALEACSAIQTVLSGLDRLEVRGRDSAGVHVLVTGHGLDLDSTEILEQVQARHDRLFENGAVRVAEGALSLVYKAASEIGRLGDNVRALRRMIESDELLRTALQADTARVAVLAHTRWASVGLINQANAHPLTGEEIDDEHAGPYVVGALNGDVDNHLELKAEAELRPAHEITTDAKVIPVLTRRRLAAGLPPEEAFRRTVEELEGSVAIAAQAVQGEAQRLMLAVRGSGQALYVGVTEDAYVVASEPYGLVESCPRYLRLDGEALSGPGGVRGQIVLLDAEGAGVAEAITRLAYDGSELPVQPEDLRAAEITTRDVDLRGYPHFLRKELDEAPASLRKTLRGRIVERGGLLSAHLGPEVVPPELVRRLRGEEIGRIVVIGQGTAAIAGSAVAAALRGALASRGISIEAIPATELSGFGLREDMRDTVAVAISQSGTTTDTNRTVDLLRGRGALVLAIVNRRGSDLTDKADGVLYTSDGRDIEMSVASTKAFYGQVAAGQILALALAKAAGCEDRARSDELLRALRELPGAMQAVLEQDEAIEEIAFAHAPSRRYWAVVGNDMNRVAAEEIRIKLSELCYKAVACDAIEDKKHIDLSSEPLTLVCAAGLTGSAADDVAKELAIFRAHEGIPLVIATDTETRFDGAFGVIRVPHCHPALDFILSTMGGHLFGYHAARAIDAQARTLRELRSRVDSAAEEAAGRADVLLELLRPAVSAFASGFGARLAAGELDGSLHASNAWRLMAATHAAVGASDPWNSSAGGDEGRVDELTGALTAAIDELTRPIDAIKHQAKTVTVGISRADEDALAVPLIHELLVTGVDRDALALPVLKTLGALDAAVAAVTGHTRYRIHGDVDEGTGSIRVVEKGGVAKELSSRAESDPRLRGNKLQVARDRQVLAAVGRSDGRTVLIVPELNGRTPVGLTLLHVELVESLTPREAQRVLEGYRGRLRALENAITETESEFEASRLAAFAPVELLTTPIEVLADRWGAAELSGAAAEPESA